MNELVCLLLAFSYTIWSTRGTTTANVGAEIAVLIVVDRDGYDDVLDADPWTTYYEHFFDMAQNRMNMLNVGIRMTLLEVKLLTEEENRKVFVQYQRVWNPNLFISLLRILLMTTYESVWNQTNVVILMTQKPLRLPALKNQRTFGESAVENMCGSLRIGVVEHHGVYVEVNTFVKVMLLSLGVHLDGKESNTRCRASEQFIMGNVPKTYPAKFQFSDCTITSARQQIGVLNSKYDDCIKRRAIPGHKKDVKPYYDFNVNLDRDKFCGFKNKKERCLVCLNGWCKRKTEITTLHWED